MTPGAGRKGLTRLARRIGWGRVFGAGVLLALLALRAADPQPLQLLRLKVFDLYQNIQPREVTQRPVVVVDIDEASLEARGQWPWPRTLLADLVGKIAAAGPAAIGFDIVFAEPDRTSPRRLAETLPELDETARAALREARDHDAALAEALRGAPVVLGQSAYDPDPDSARETAAPKASFATMGGDPKRFLIEYPGLLANIAELEEAAAGRGMFTVLPDADGVVRRVPAALVAEGALVPSLSADMLRVAGGEQTYLIRSGTLGIETIAVAGVRLPTDSTGQLWLHFSPHRPDRFVSAADVLDGEVPAGRFNRRLVLIGTSASGLMDEQATPLGPAMPGVEIHAQLLESVLAGALLERPAYVAGGEILLALAVGLAILVLAPVLGALTVLLLGLGVAALLIGVSWYGFAGHGLLLDATYPLLSSFAVFLSMISLNYFREEAQRRRIRAAFGQYLSPDLVERLAADPGRLALGGETREMTVLFCDVREFTSLSESYKADPQGLTALINRLLTPLSAAILDHGGTIDKYMGDNVMAFWNAPLDDPDHARNACAAALAMLERLEAVNAEREAEARAAGEAFRRLEIGVGLNTGECVVGNMGSDMRFDYTVLGDAVNLAARLEGQSAFYGARVIIGEATAKRVGGEFVTMELDSIRVKGKSEPERIYTLLGRHDAVEAGRQAARKRIESAIAAYRERDWDGARAAIKSARETEAGQDFSALCDLYEARIAEFRETPPPEDWDGVYTATRK